MINCVDLFAGPGGLSLGFELVRDEKGRRAFNLLKVVEKDHWACKTLRKNFTSDIVIEGDITNDDVKDRIVNECMGKTDLVVGGPPCQSFSTIGPRSGNPGDNKDKFKYDRLYKHFIEIVDRLRPDFFIFENVRGILSKKNGDKKVIDIIISEVESMGYYLENDCSGNNDKYLLLNAADYGVPQTRERVFLIGNRLGVPNPYPSPTHYNPEMFPLSQFLETDQFPYVTLRDAIGDMTKLKAKKTFTHIPRYKIRKIKNYNEKVFSGEDELDYDEDRLRDCLKELGPSGKQFIRFVRNGADGVLRHHMARPQQESDIKLFAGMKPGSNSKDVFKSGERRMKKLAKLIKYDMTSFKDKYKKHSWNKPCSTIFAHMRKDGNRFIHPDGRQARTFTPREAARIQSFPDSFVFEGSINRKFEQIGNAVPPLLAKAIAGAILSKWRESQ